MRRLLISAAVLAMTVAGARAQTPAASEGRPVAPGEEILEQVLVKVNGDILTKSELEQRQIAALRQKMNGQVNPEELKDDARLKQLLAEVTPEVLVSAVNEMLLVQRGRELGLHLGDDQFREIVNNIRKEQNLEDEDKFQAALRQEGMTLQDLRNQLERQMLIQRVQQQEVGSKLTITEAEAREYYDQHHDEFTEQASIMLREILVKVESGGQGVNVAKDDEAAKKIADIRARIVGGQDFGAVASQVSEAASKANGGLIGPFSRQDMSPELQKLVDAMKPGDVTAPVRTPAGYQIFKLESMKPAALQPFDQVRDLIAEKVSAARTRTEMRKFLARLRDQAIIEWKNDDLKAAYEKQLAQDNAAPAAG